MDKDQAIELARRYIGIVNKSYQLENAFLFGSYAKGTNHKDSDIDLALIFKSVDDMFDLQVELMQIRSDDDLIIEPHPFTIEGFNQSNPMASEILKHGIEIKNFLV